MRAKIQTHTRFLRNPTTQTGEDDHEADPLVAETNLPLPQAEPRHLLENQQSGPEESQERDSPLEPRPDPMIEL